MIHMNIDLINKITAIFSFNLTDIQFASDDSFISVSLTHALSALNTCTLSTISCLFTSALTLYDFQQLILDSLLNFMKVN